MHALLTRLSCWCTNTGMVTPPYIVQAGARMGVHLSRFFHDLCSVSLLAAAPGPNFFAPKVVHFGGSTWATWSEPRAAMSGSNGDDPEAIGLLL